MARVMVVGTWLLLSWAGLANADHSAGLSVNGSCPTREALIAAFHRVIPELTITADASGTKVRILVVDDADAYRVEVEDVVRTFVDAARQCGNRAQKVAVVVASALSSPVIEAVIPAPSADTTMEAPKAHAGETSTRMVLPAPTFPPSDVVIRIETGGVLDSAAGVGFGSDVFTTGIGVHMVLGRELLGLVVGGALTSPVDMPMTTAIARVQRLPIDLAVRRHIGSTLRTKLALEIGPRFAIQRSEAIIDSVPGARAMRLETGIRSAARIEVWPWRAYGLFVALQTEFVPRPSQFTLMQDEVGRMPSWWVGTSAGLALRML